MNEISSDKDNKLLNARDTILAFVIAKDFAIKEIKTVLQMCNDEIDAWDKRANLKEINKKG